MKRLAILCFSMLLISACSEKKESASQASKNDLGNYTHSGSITSYEVGNSKIGDWRYDPIKKEIRIDINRSVLNGVSLDQGRVITSSHLLGLYYYNGDDDKIIGVLFLDTLTAVIPPGDFSCDLKNPAEAFKSCLTLTLHDPQGTLIHPVIGEF